MRIVPQPGNDWFFIGKSLRKYHQFPLGIPEDDIILEFADVLSETIPLKLKELIDVQDDLIKDRTDKLEALSRIKNINDESLDFMASLIEFEFSEYDVIQRWFKYWLRLAQKSGKTNGWTVDDVNKNGFTEEEIDRAKQVPIEDLFDGKLRQMGSRYVGKCPFHKENTASFTIFSNDNSYYCFGCHKHGDAIDFYMKLNDCEFPKAIGGLLNG